MIQDFFTLILYSQCFCCLVEIMIVQHFAKKNRIIFSDFKEMVIWQLLGKKNAPPLGPSNWANQKKGPPNDCHFHFKFLSYYQNEDVQKTTHQKIFNFGLMVSNFAQSTFFLAQILKFLSKLSLVISNYTCQQVTTCNRGSNKDLLMVSRGASEPPPHM